MSRHIPVIAYFPDFVLRAHVVNGELRVYANHIVNGQEHFPLGYLTGSNCLLLKSVTIKEEEKD